MADGGPVSASVQRFESVADGDRRPARIPVGLLPSFAMRSTACLLLTLAALLCVACPPTETITGLPNQPGGNPLVPDRAMYPFPSDLYLEADASTRTGRRVSFPAEALPPGFTPDLWADHDGYSRIPAILTWFPEGVDPASLPDPHDPGASTQPDSSVLLVEEGSWSRIPVLAELDLNARGAFEQALIIRPHHALRAGTGYAVLLRSTLRSETGEPLEVEEAFRALRDGVPTDSDEIEAQRADFAMVLEAAEAVGVPTEELVLAWSFHTRSEEQVTGPLLAMQEAMADHDLPDWELDVQETDGDDTLITGRFVAPWFLDDEFGIQLDGSGLPIQQGTSEVEFHLAIPDTVDEPRPVICFGHGFFSGKEEIGWGSFARLRQEKRMSAAAIDFRGFAEIDLVDTVPILSGDLFRVPQIVNRQVQNVAGFTLLARLVREQLAVDVQLDRGAGPFAPLDPEQVHYMGISNGGTQGLTIMSTSPFFTRGVLVVPGGGWTHMLQRAVQWNEFAAVLEEDFDGPLEMQLVMSLMQALFDPADSLNYAQRLTDDRFDGRTDVRVTLHEAVEDSQVANLVTDWVARTAGVSLVTPSARDIWGLQTVEAAPPLGADVNSAMFVYDMQLPANPEGNVPPPEDNGSHRDVRDQVSYFEQVGAFLETGAIVQVCDGACDPD